MRFSLILLVACVGIVHVPQQTRGTLEQDAAHVQVITSCVDQNYFGDIVWGGSTASGVVISERHVITAAHAVRCPVPPRVVVRLANGRKFQMYVERDDAVYGSGSDVARLTIANADTFGLGIAPPVLGVPRDQSTVCLAAGGCGILSVGFDIAAQLYVRPGDSGRGVYDLRGRFVGIVVRGSVWAKIEPIGLYWLEGT